MRWTNCANSAVRCETHHLGLGSASNPPLASHLDVPGPSKASDELVLLSIEGEPGDGSRQDAANTMGLILPDGDPDILDDHFFVVIKCTNSWPSGFMLAVSKTLA